METFKLELVLDFHFFERPRKGLDNGHNVDLLDEILLEGHIALLEGTLLARGQGLAFL